MDQGLLFYFCIFLSLFFVSLFFSLLKYLCVSLISICFFLFISISVSLFLFFFNLPTYICLLNYLSIYLYSCLSSSPFIYLFVYLFLSLSVCLPIYQSIYLSTVLSVLSLSLVYLYHSITPVSLSDKHIHYMTVHR